MEQLMGVPNSTIRTRVKREIEALADELDQRKQKPRPLPRSVLLAYHTLIEKHYRRLADLSL